MKSEAVQNSKGNSKINLYLPQRPDFVIERIL